MTIKTGQALVSLGPQLSSAVMSHPAQRASFGRIAGLIGASGRTTATLPCTTTSPTACGSLTEFTENGMWLREIKRTPHTERAQMDREQAAVDALMHGGELPGPRRGARLIQLTEPYVTNLAQLGELIQMAKERGCAGTALSQGRALLASSLPACWAPPTAACWFVVTMCSAGCCRRGGAQAAWSADLPGPG